MNRTPANRSRSFLSVLAGAVVALCLTFVAVPRSQEALQSAPFSVFDTGPLQMTGHLPEPMSIDVSPFQMTGHLPDTVTINTAPLEMTGHLPGPIVLSTSSLEMTGHAWSSSLVETAPIIMTGHRFEPVAVEAEPLRMTGHRFEPVAVATDAIRMTGHRFEPVAVEAGAIRMTGHRFEPVTVVAEAIQMTGHRFNPVTLTANTLIMTGHGDATDGPRREPEPGLDGPVVETETLVMTGHRFDPIAVEAGVIRMTGHRFEPAIVGTDTLRMTGHRFTPTSVDADTLRMTGHRFDPASVETDFLRMTGHRFDPVVVETDGLLMTGHRGEPEGVPEDAIVTLDTAALEMTGHLPDPVTIETAALQMTGFLPNPASLDTPTLRMTGFLPGPVTLETPGLEMTGYDGYEPEPERPVSPDLGIAISGPNACEAGEACAFSVRVAHAGGSDHAGVVSIMVIPPVDDTELTGVGPRGSGWSCRPGQPISCVATSREMAEGVQTELNIGLRIPRRLSAGTSFEACAEFAPPSVGSNQTLFVQYMLLLLGVAELEVDGLIGPNTRGAVEEFQRQFGLQVNGEIDASLLEALQAQGTPDDRTENNRACTTVAVTKTITCGFGEQVVGEACEPICSGRSENWNGNSCVTCGSGERWSAERLRCDERPPDCETATTELRGGECRCAFDNMERESATSCRCTGSRRLVAGEGCVRPQPDCPFGQFYNQGTGQCAFICISPGYSTDAGCACPDGQRYRIFRGGCPEPERDGSNRN